jgi:hypothetical protein
MPHWRVLGPVVLADSTIHIRPASCCLQHSRTGVAHVQQVVRELHHRRWQLLLLLLWWRQLKLLLLVLLVRLLQWRQLIVLVLLLLSRQLKLLVLLQVLPGVWRWRQGLLLVQRGQLLLLLVLLLGRMTPLQLYARHRSIHCSAWRLKPWGRDLAAPLQQQLLRLRHLLQGLLWCWRHPLHNISLLLLVLGSLELLELLLVQ